jgi:protein-disulfide isomerase
MSYGLSDEAYLRYATDLGLDLDNFTNCLESGRAQQEVREDYRYGTGVGVQSTPTFFVNGTPLVGAQPFEAFQQVIEEELAQ